MFNEERKKLFLSIREKGLIVEEGYLSFFFKRIEPYEERLNKDLCDFSTREIIDSYKMMNISSIGALKVLNSQYSIYTEWCLKENLVKDNQNHFAELNLSLLEQCINKFAFQQKVLTREQVYDLIDQLPNAREKFCILGLFEIGTSYRNKSLMLLKPDDLLPGGLRLFDGRVVSVSDKFREIILETIQEDYGKLFSDTDRQIALAEEPYIFRRMKVRRIDCEDEDKKLKQRFRAVQLLFTQAMSYLRCPEITPTNISDSGKIDMILRRCKELNITSKEYIRSDYVKEIEHQYGRTIQTSFVVKYKEILDYK